MQASPVLTIGYGDRSIGALPELLLRYKVSRVIDVRSRPYSRFNPDVSRPALESYLRSHGLEYLYMGDALGGQPNDPDCYRNGKVDYATYAHKPSFTKGLRRLRSAWEQGLRLVVMCSEDVFFRALLEASVETFCDLRARRGVRGRTYAFANRTRLERELRKLGIS